MVKLMLNIVIIFLLFSACKSNKNLFMPTEVNNSNKLRLNGYYYEISSTDFKLVSWFYLYENGVLYRCGTIDFEKDENLEPILDSIVKLKFSKSNKSFASFSFWGKYKVYNDSIYLLRQGPGQDKPQFNIYGKILNDSTFETTKSNQVGKKRINQYPPVVYRFRESFSKPDSLNKFFK
jgi:hypothetical protein